MLKRLVEEAESIRIEDLSPEPLTIVLLRPIAWQSSIFITFILFDTKYEAPIIICVF